MFTQQKLNSNQARALPLRLLAHLGDAVFHLFEREREIFSAANARQLHNLASRRVSATTQARLLESLSEALTVEEQDIVRRARNLKPSGYRKTSQSDYRKATALEALVGYLYLTDAARLKEILDQAAGTVISAGSAAADKP